MVKSATANNEVLARFQQDAPVDVAALAEALGINVWESDDLPPGVAGKLFRDVDHGGSKGFSIIVKASDSYNRRRFTVAHEIAHFLLHRNSVGESISEGALYRGGLGTRQEIEANRLAAEILMPPHLVQKWTKHCGPDASSMAAKFAVSEAAMSIRLGLS